MDYPPPSTSGAVPNNLADPVKRLIAALIDGGIVVGIIIATFIVAAIFGAVSSALGFLVILVGYLGAFGFGIYNLIVLQGNTGQSMGKKMQGIKVVAEGTGQPLGIGGAIVRYLVHSFIDGICLAGYVYGYFINPKRQTVGDMVAKSYVVDA